MTDEWNSLYTFQTGSNFLVAEELNDLIAKQCHVLLHKPKKIFLKVLRIRASVSILMFKTYEYSFHDFNGFVPIFNFAQN